MKSMMSLPHFILRVVIKRQILNNIFQLKYQQIQDTA